MSCLLYSCSTREYKNHWKVPVPATFVLLLVEWLHSRVYRGPCPSMTQEGASGSLLALSFQERDPGGPTERRPVFYST